jgi:hypothetical protein
LRKDLPPTKESVREEPRNPKDVCIQ